jgi:beta-lactam-binding protein with PASTA domain
MKQWIAFLTSKTFGLNALVALGSGLLLIFLVQVLLGAITRHQDELVVPALEGLSYADASAQLEEMDLELLVIDSSQYNPKWPALSIVDQNPPVGSRVKSGREIKVTLNPARPRKVQLPALQEKTLRRAIFDLESKGLVVGNLSYQPYLAKDVVLQVAVNGKDLQPGTWLEPGTRVDLVLGQGLGGQMTSCPSLWGKTLQQAKAILTAHSLVLGGILFDNPNDSLTAVVYRQSPSPQSHSQVQMGEAIDVWLSTDQTKIPRDSLWVE